MSNTKGIQEVVTYIQNSGMRDKYLIEKKCKEFCMENNISLEIVHCEKVRNKCTFYYYSNDTYSIIDFELKKIKKQDSLKGRLRLEQWERQFNQKILTNPYHLEEMKRELIDWVNSNPYLEEKEHFLKTFKIYVNYQNQVIISYSELNGEAKKIKPILHFFEPVSLDKMYQFAKIKCLELWEREFDGQIKIQKNFWVNLLGTYDSDNKTIYFSAHLNGTQSQEEVLDTLLHELVHWHLHTTGRPYFDDDFEFIEELLRVGGSLSKAADAQKAYERYKSQH